MMKGMLRNVGYTHLERPKDAIFLLVTRHIVGQLANWKLISELSENTQLYLIKGFLCPKIKKLSDLQFAPPFPLYR